MNGPFFKNEWRNGLPFIAHSGRKAFKVRVHIFSSKHIISDALTNMSLHLIDSEKIGISVQLCDDHKVCYYRVRLYLIKVGILVVCCLILCILRHLACRNLSLWATIWSFISQGYLFWLQGVLALCEFHYCEFHYCGFSKISKILPYAIFMYSWLMRFWG